MIMDKIAENGIEQWAIQEPENLGWRCTDR